MESIGEQKQYPEMHEGWIADFYLRNTETGAPARLVRGLPIISIENNIIHFEENAGVPNGKLSYDIPKDDIVNATPPEVKMAA